MLNWEGVSIKGPTVSDPLKDPRPAAVVLVVLTQISRPGSPLNSCHVQAELSLVAHRISLNDLQSRFKPTSTWGKKAPLAPLLTTLMVVIVTTTDYTSPLNNSRYSQSSCCGDRLPRCFWKRLLYRLCLFIYFTNWTQIKAV